MKFLNCLILILIVSLSPNAHSAIQTAGQITMSKHIDVAMEWAKHLRDEVQKGAKSNPKEIDGDVAGIMSLLAAMNVTADQIAVDSPSEKGDGHFMEMRRFQEAATLATKKFPIAKSGIDPNFSKMKSASKKILENLENVKYSHDLELSEIEKDPKN